MWKWTDNDILCRILTEVLAVSDDGSLWWTIYRPRPTATHFPRVKTFVHRHLFPTVTLSQSNKPSWNLMAEHGGCFTYWAFWSSMCLALRCLTCGRCREVPSSLLGSQILWMLFHLTFNQVQWERSYLPYLLSIVFYSIGFELISGKFTPSFEDWHEHREFLRYPIELHVRNGYEYWWHCLAVVESLARALASQQ